MAEEPGMKDTSSSIEFNCDSSDSTVVIKIKTLDFQTYSFRVNNNMPLSALKEEIATKIGVPFEQQRLLYKGKVLKDDQLLSEFNLEDGDTMHLVERQPVQSQHTSSTNGNQGTGEESSQNLDNNQSDNPVNIHSVLLNQAPISVPFANTPDLQYADELTVAPEALPTICEFINRLQGVLRNSNIWNNDPHQVIFTRTDFFYPGVVPNLELLSYVLDRTEELLRDNLTPTISHLSTCLQRIDSSSNSVLRGQIQSEAMQLGAVMQHLGAMFLELGRVTMCLRMGETPEESILPAGPVVYITTRGPNPRMIRPLLPPQPSTSSGTFNPVYFRIEESVPTLSTSEVLSSTTSTGGQIHEPNLQSPAPSGSDSAPALGAQANDMHSNTTQGFHAVVSNEIQSEEDKDWFCSDTKDVVGAEEGKQNKSEETHVSYLDVSGKVEQQVGIGQAVERNDQNGDHRSIFGALHENYGEEQDVVYQDMVELGNNEELANEFMPVSRRDIRRRLAKESSSSTDKS